MLVPTAVLDELPKLDTSKPSPIAKNLKKMYDMMIADGVKVVEYTPKGKVNLPSLSATWGRTLRREGIPLKVNIRKGKLYVSRID